MEVVITIECDKCNESHVMILSGENAIDVWSNQVQKLTTSGIRYKLIHEGWHILRSCLCPKCKSEVGEENCMNCKHHDYKEFNHRCCRKISNGGFVQLDGSVISDFDTCEHFANI